jgi:hypothetical protein
MGFSIAGLGARITETIFPITFISFSFLILAIPLVL